MRIRQAALFTATLLLAGCSSLLVSSTPAPVYYQLDDRAPSATCSGQFSKGVRIQPFSASSPFDQPAMVVEQSKNRVLFSNTYQWVANPGALITQKLRRDLSLTPLFPQVASADNPTMVPLDLTGHVFTFAWVKENSQARAQLEVEISLIDTETHHVLLRKNYRLEGNTYSSVDSDTFARAMSALVKRFSDELQRDLCNSIPST